MSERMKLAFDAIRAERAWQTKKWGTLEQHPHTVAEWIVILRSELREAEEGWCHGSGDDDALAEIVQVAAVAVACLEQHGIGAYSRPGEA